LEGFENALFVLPVMFEYGGCSHKTGLNGSFDTANDADNVSENLLLADFVHAHHSITVIQE
jgi:hypothetical protein